MDLNQKVSREVVAGFLLGAICLTGILSILNATEQTAIAFSFDSMGSIPE